MVIWLIEEASWGKFFLFAGSPVSWSSKNKDFVTLSTWEVEYITACSATCQALRLSALLKELRLWNEEESVELLVDSKSTIDLDKNHVSHGKSKHIGTKLHFLRDQVSKGRIKCQHCRTKLQHANILIKPLKSERVKELRKMMNVLSL